MSCQSSPRKTSSPPITMTASGNAWTPIAKACCLTGWSRKAKHPGCDRRVMSLPVPDASFWRGRRVFLTGHSGFVGGWTALWLTKLGAEVHGFSLPAPTDPSFFVATKLDQRIAKSTIGDVRDREPLAKAAADAKPGVV